jgi:hypothetical protein
MNDEDSADPKSPLVEAASERLVRDATYPKQKQLPAADFVCTIV